LNKQVKSKMGTHGGKRIGAGRKTVSEEVNSRELCTRVLIKKYGSLDLAIENLLKDENPILKKFVFEHAIGKPTENVNLSGEVEIKQITGMIIK